VRNNGKYDADDDAHQRHDVSNAQKHVSPRLPIYPFGFSTAQMRSFDFPILSCVVALTISAQLGIDKGER
jgi:hypothetical protein